ncbi:MAG TPA: hypothetical protein VIY28_13885 [Pseudonocardiaceae bacterium]
MITRLLPAVLIAATLAACGSGTSLTRQAPMTAQQVVAHLAQRVSSATPSVVFTAETDKNKLLGRPGGYVSKASFTDSRISPTGEGFTDTSPGAADAGGSVEVFADDQAAGARLKYIQAITANTPMFTEYDYVSGPVLVRVSRSLTPQQAAEYQSALAQIG